MTLAPVAEEVTTVAPDASVGAASGTTESGGRLRRRLYIVDLVALLVSWSSILLFDRGGADSALEIGAAALAGMFVIRAQGLYETWVNTMRVVVVARLFGTTAAAAVGASVVDLWRTGSIDLAPILVGTVLSFFCLVSGRGAFDRWLAARRSAGAYRRPIVLIGGGVDVDETLEFLDEHPELGYRVVGWVGPPSELPDATYLGPVTDAVHQVQVNAASGAIVLANDLDRTELNDLCRRLVDAGVHVHVSSALAGISYRRLVTVPVGHEPFVRLAPVTMSRSQLAVKRGMDLLLSSLLILVSLPLLGICALLIKRHDRGPVLFAQTRVGQDGKPITVHKLRSMVVDAEDRLAQLLEQNERDGPLFKLTDDPRITPIGRFIRSTSIDELPQLFDVLRGDLSLVGPRPALPQEVSSFDDELLARLRVRPGVTGLWQVEARDKASFNSYRRLDLFYVDNWSLALDLAIILDSIPAVLGRALFRRSRAD